VSAQARHHLAVAIDRHAQALERRKRFQPHEPGYREAVHQVGVTWAQVQRWRRLVSGDPGLTR
jgi:hypothetical protein